MNDKKIKPLHRVFASLLDWFLIIFVIVVIFLVPALYMLNDFLHSQPIETSRIVSISLTAFFSFIVLSLIYFISMPLLMRGQTLGKKLFHIRLMRIDGKDLNLLTLLNREGSRLIVIVFSLGLGVVSDLISMILGKNQYCFYDVFAQTSVVDIDYRR